MSDICRFDKGDGAFDGPNTDLCGEPVKVEVDGTKWCRKHGISIAKVAIEEHPDEVHLFLPLDRDDVFREKLERYYVLSRSITT